MVACKCGNYFASQANNRVSIQTSSSTDDGYGGRTTSWVTASTVWAIIEPTRMREGFNSDQHQSRADAKVTIRYQAALSDTTTAAAMRMSYGNRTYNIIGVQNLSQDMKTEGSAFQRIFVTEGQPS